MSWTSRAIARRTYLKLTGCNIVATASNLLASSEGSAQQLAQSVSSDAALDRLLTGNQRFIQQKRLSPHQSRLRSTETANSQYPFHRC